MEKIDISNFYKRWTEEEIIDLVGYSKEMTIKDIALMLSRTERGCSSKLSEIKEKGLYDEYLIKFQKNNFK